MQIAIVALVLVGFFYPSESKNCASNPCELSSGYFNMSNGYRCIDVDGHAFCTCPNGRYEFERPCRLCGQSDSSKDVCRRTPKLVACIEHNLYGTSYYCLCHGPTPGSVTATLDVDCDVTNALKFPVVSPS